MRVAISFSGHGVLTVSGVEASLTLTVSLVRNTLQLDTIPNQSTVKTFGEHLLAEMEQMTMIDKKMKPSGAAQVFPSSTTTAVRQLGSHGGFSRVF